MNHDLTSTNSQLYFQYSMLSLKLSSSQVQLEFTDVVHRGHTWLDCWSPPLEACMAFLYHERQFLGIGLSGQFQPHSRGPASEVHTVFSSTHLWGTDQRQQQKTVFWDSVRQPWPADQRRASLSDNEAVLRQSLALGGNTISPDEKRALTLDMFIYTWSWVYDRVGECSVCKEKMGLPAFQIPLIFPSSLRLRSPISHQSLVPCCSLTDLQPHSVAASLASLMRPPSHISLQVI